MRRNATLDAVSGSTVLNPRRKKLLFIANRHLGDAVLTTGLLAKVIERYGPCDVTIACGRVPAPLFSQVPGLKRIIFLDKKDKEWLRLWKEATQVYWDIILDMRNSVVSYLVPRKKVFRYASIDFTEHKSVQFAKVLKLAEVPYNRIWLSEAAQEKAREMLPDGAPVLVLCPTSGYSLKNWPLDRFAELALRLPFQRIAILCAPHEREEAKPLFAALQHKKEVIDLSQTDPLEAAACLARCSLCVANDSGLMHVSAAVGTPTVGIFGPTDDTVYAPHGPYTAIVRGASCVFPKSKRWKGLFRLMRALGYDPRGKNMPDPQRLMQAVSVESVAEAAKKLMDRQRDEAPAASAALS